jgi:hypothetical protein
MFDLIECRSFVSGDRALGKPGFEVGKGKSDPQEENNRFNQLISINFTH